MIKRLRIMGIDFELYDNYNIKAVAKIGNKFLCAFNCGTKYINTSEEVICEVMGEVIKSGNGLIEVLNSLHYTQYNEDEIELGL